MWRHIRGMDATTATQREGACARIELRTNMFVLATISALSASGPVKIRNLSPSGALVEGAVLPPAGEQVELRRGARVAYGRVAWCQNGKAGLRFDGRLQISDWMPNGDQGQQRVDSVVEELKDNGVTASSLVDSSISQFARLAPSDLRRLARELDVLADEFAEDIYVVGRFGTKLQTLDIVSQVLRRLSGRGA